MRTCGLLFTVVPALVLMATETPATAQRATARKELISIRRNLAKVPGLLRRKKVAEARKLVSDAETRLKKVLNDSKLNPRSRTVIGLKRLLLQQKQRVLKAQGNNPQSAGISFDKQVAPILKQRCSGCHSNNPKGGLRLDNVAGVRKGGSSGSLYVPGKPNQSRIIQRLVANGNQRMPKGGRPLSKTQIQTIALWIAQGAKFDGQSAKTAAKTPGPKSKSNNKPVNITIPKPTGEETVSFTKDIAPWMVNLCLNCHNDRRKSGGLSLETFEQLMAGGKSGRVVLPGNLDGSRMWDLVGKQKPFKMPRGQALITRTNWRDLRTWIQEGAKFDGKDAKAKLRSLVPTEEELKAQRFAKMSAEEFAQFRRKRTEDLWERVLPKVSPQQVETKGFFIFGNTSKARLEEIGKWADSHAERLRKTFRDKSGRLFKGKLSIIVMKDRFSYEEFNLVIQKREVPREMTGHSVVDKLYEDAYIVLQDVGDDATDSSPGMHVNLIDHLTGAYLKRDGGKLPDWILRGTGLALAAQVEPKNAYINKLRDDVPGILRTVQKPEAIFANGTFSPVDVAAVGYTLVDFLLRAGGGAKFGRFMTSLQRGNNMKGALKAVYQSDPASLARAYAGSLGRKGSRRR